MEDNFHAGDKVLKLFEGCFFLRSIFFLEREESNFAGILVIFSKDIDKKFFELKSIHAIGLLFFFVTLEVNLFS